MPKDCSVVAQRPRAKALAAIAVEVDLHGSSFLDGGDGYCTVFLDGNR
jgi:hypothetical protein